MIAGFVLVAIIALDRPGYYYDEVIFVPVALRALGQCDVDAAVTVQAGCLPLMQTLGYVGAVKAWLHAPIFAAFGINVWTVRLPSILIAAASLFVALALRAARAGRRLVAAAAGAAGHGSGADQPRAPRLGPADDRDADAGDGAGRALALAADRTHALARGRSASRCSLGFFDKLNFVWVIAALGGATALVAPRARGRAPARRWPWQPARGRRHRRAAAVGHA